MGRSRRRTEKVWEQKDDLHAGSEALAALILWPARDRNQEKGCMSWGQAEPGGSYLSSSEWNDLHSGIDREESPHLLVIPPGHIVRHEDCPLKRGQISVVAVDLDCNRVDVGRVGNRCNAAAITKEIEPCLEIGVFDNGIQKFAGFVLGRGPIDHIRDQSNSPINGEVNAHDTPASVSPCCLDNFRRIGSQTPGVKKCLRMFGR